MISIGTLCLPKKTQPKPSPRRRRWLVLLIILLLLAGAGGLIYRQVDRRVEENTAGHARRYYFQPQFAPNRRCRAG